MRIDLIPTAERIATDVLTKCGKGFSFLDVSEITCIWIENNEPGMKVDEEDELIEYVDYLARHATINVVLPKERL